MQSITIKKAKLKDHSSKLECEFEEHLSDGITNQVKRISDASVHPDMVEAFEKLAPHLAHICEEISRQEFLKGSIYLTADQAEQFLLENADREGGPIEGEKIIKPINEKFLVTGFVITDKKGPEEVMLIGRKYLSNDKIVNINSPFTSEDRDEYKYAGELFDALRKCKEEVMEFLLDGKVAPSDQMELDFDGKEDPAVKEKSHEDGEEDEEYFK